MSNHRHLDPEPESNPDAVFRNFMRHSLAYAADHFGLTVTGAPKFGWRLRSIGAHVDNERWLRVVSERPRWAQGHTWTGNVDANAITEVPKSRVLHVYEWNEGN